MLKSEKNYEDEETKVQYWCTVCGKPLGECRHEVSWVSDINLVRLRKQQPMMAC